MIKVAYVSPALMYPAKGGPYLRVCNSIKALHCVTELHVLSTTPLIGEAGIKTRRYYTKLCHSFVQLSTISTVTSKMAWAVTLFDRHIWLKKFFTFVRSFLAYEISMFFFREYVERKEAVEQAKKIAIYCKKNSIQTVWISYASISTALIHELSRTDARFKIIADTDSVWSEFIGRGISYENSALRRLWLQFVKNKKRDEEKEFCNSSHIVTAVSEVDASYYKNIVTDKDKVRLFYNGIDLQNYRAKTSKKNSRERNKKSISLFFSGSFGPHSPNTKAIAWFFKSIFPIITKTVDQKVTLTIAGSGSEDLRHELSHQDLYILGTVDSMVDHIQSADIVIVPLQFESGTRYKILEAGACHKAVVSTTLGAEGLQVTNRQQILIADDAENFAQAVIQLIDSETLQETLADNLYQTIRNSYSLDALEKQAKEILELSS